MVYMCIIELGNMLADSFPLPPFGLRPVRKIVNASIDLGFPGGQADKFHSEH